MKITRRTMLKAGAAKADEPKPMPGSIFCKGVCFESLGGQFGGVCDMAFDHGCDVLDTVDYDPQSLAGIHWAKGRLMTRLGRWTPGTELNIRHAKFTGRVILLSSAGDFMSNGPFTLGV